MNFETAFGPKIVTKSGEQDTAAVLANKRFVGELYHRYNKLSSYLPSRVLFCTLVSSLQTIHSNAL